MATRGIRISDELRKEIKEMIDAGVKCKEIMEVYGVSSFTYYSIKNDKKTSKKKDTTEQQQQQTVSTNSKTIITNRIKETVVAGLIKDRHDMPVDEYVIDHVSDTFNYSLIDSKISEFILRKIGISMINGENVANKNLVVYCTGLTCATASLVKLCSIYRVNLSLMHYRIKENDYIEQVIFRTFDRLNSIYENIFESTNVIEGINEVSFVDVDESYLVPGASLYTIKNNDKLLVYKDLAQVWERYMKIMAEVPRIKGTVNISILHGTLNKSKRFSKEYILINTSNI